jgi:hypothetical protein
MIWNFKLSYILGERERLHAAVAHSQTRSLGLVAALEAACFFLTLPILKVDVRKTEHR